MESCPFCAADLAPGDTCTCPDACADERAEVRDAEADWKWKERGYVDR